MRIYKRNNSPNWWATWYGQNGRRRRKSTGTEDKDLARTIVAKWQQEDFLERHFGTIPDTPFQDSLVRYGQERKRENPQAYEDNVKYRLQRLIDSFGHLNIGDIKFVNIQDYADLRFKSVSRATVLKELSTLKAILNKAFREGFLPAMPPFPKIKPVQGRNRWLTVEEEVRLLKAASPHLKLIIQFALDTGGRRSEILKLNWQNVDLDRGFITFTKTKNGEDRAVRLTERARKVLVEIGPKKSGNVFTFNDKPIRSVKTSFDSAREKAGVEDFRFHDLRHTFASRLVQQGIPLYEVMQLTGHKSFQMVQRYAHLAPEFQEKAISALEVYGQPAPAIYGQGGACPSDGHNLGTVTKNSVLDSLSITLKNPLASQGV